MTFSIVEGQVQLRHEIRELGPSRLWDGKMGPVSLRAGGIPADIFGAHDVSKSNSGT